MSEKLKNVVRDHYAKIAGSKSTCCGPGGSTSGCCGPSRGPISLQIGYTEEDREIVPEAADLGLGCGNPVALASLKEGEVVVDLGSAAEAVVSIKVRAVKPD